MSDTRILAWNTTVQMVGKGLSTAIGIVIVGLMTRLLGQEGFGMYSTATAFFQIFALTLDLGINVMLVQMLGERAGDKAYEDRILSATFTFRLVSAFVILSAAPIIGLLLNYPWELKATLFIVWASFFASVVNQIVICAEQRHLKMHVAAIADVAGRVLQLGGMLAAYAAGWGLLPIAGIMSLGALANFLINLAVSRRFASFKWNWDPAFWKVLLSRSWPIGFSILFNLIYFKADTLVLSYVRPMAEVGIYGAAYRVLEILITVPFMYTGVLLPLLAHSWVTKDTARFRRLVGHSYTAMALLAAPMVVGVFVLGEQIMTAVAGADFAASGSILKILMLAVGTIYLGTVSSHMIVALDLQRRTIKLYVAVAAVTLAGYVLFIPTYGMMAAAWLTVFSEACVALGTTIISLRVSKCGVAWKPVIKTLAAAGLMGICILPMRNLWLPIPILAGAVLYAIFVLGTGAVSKTVVKELLSVKRSTAADGIEGI